MVRIFQHPLVRDATRVDEVQADPRRFAPMRTAVDGRRIVGWFSGELPPRIY